MRVRKASGRTVGCQGAGVCGQERRWFPVGSGRACAARAPGPMGVVLFASALLLGAGNLAGAAPRVLEDFEDVSDWSGLERETAIVRVGTAAGRWRDTVQTTSVRKDFDPPLDLSETDHIGFWLYSAAANGAGIQVVFRSDRESTSGLDYYTTEIRLDWEGWRWIWLSKEDLGPRRSPLGWDQIQTIQFAASGWGHEPRADTDLVFDQLVAANAVMEQVVRRDYWSGADFVYEYEVRLREPDGTATGVDVRLDAPGELQVEVDPGHVELPAHGTASVRILLRVPAALQSQVEPYHLWQVEFVLETDAGVRESWTEAVACPAQRAESPRTFLTRADLDRMAAWADAHAWAASIRDGIVARADGWPESFQDRYGLAQWALPPEGGQWGGYYVCPVHGVALRYEPPMTHRCPVDGATYSGWPYDQVIYARQHRDLAKAARDLALAWQLTGDPTYAQQAVDILTAYADRYESYAIHDKDGGASESGARVLSQTLDEAVWLIPLAWAYDLVLDSGLVDETLREHIEQGLLRPAAAVIARHDAGTSNWQAWHNAALAAAGRAMEDPRLVARAIYGTHGFFFHMDESVSADGFWYEGSWGYHFYTLSALTYLAELGKRAGVDLFGDERLKSMYVAPLLFAPPDLVLPAFNDSHSFDLRGAGRDRMEVGYAEYGDEAFLLALVGTSRPEAALFWGAEDLPGEAPPPVRESLVFPESGYAVLRGGTASDPWWAALDFGPHGGWHGHYDKLNLVLFARGRMLGLDPGSHSYSLPLHDSWDRSTVAHNTVVVDESVQNAATGGLERFLALPGLVWVRANGGEAAAPAAALARDVVMPEGYLVDRFTVDATDGAEHQADWFWHAEGALTTEDLEPEPYSGLPQEAGYQHLEDVRAASSDGDVRFLFSWDGEQTYPGRIWANDPRVEASQSYDGGRVHSGTGAVRLDYDFSGADPDAYVLFSTRSMAQFGTEVPTGLAVWIFGDGSGNSVRLRIVDDTGESHVSPATTLDFTGWRRLSFDVDDTWSHWSGNDDGVIDLPLSRLVLQLGRSDGGAPAGSLWLDDWTLTFPNAGEVTAEDYERPSARLRLWVAGQPGSVYVTARGIGPDLLVPVDCFFVRRSGRHVSFDVLGEPHGQSGPRVTGFVVLQPADASGTSAGYRVETRDWVDRLVLVGRGQGGTDREFGEGRVVTDGILAWVRTTDSAATPLLRLALAEGSRLAVDGRDLFSGPAVVGRVSFSVARPEVTVDLLDGDLEGARLLAPGTERVTYRGRDVPFDLDGDYVVFGRLVESGDSGPDDGDGGPAADGGPAGGTESGCGCRTDDASGAWPWLLGLLVFLFGAWRRRRASLSGLDRRGGHTGTIDAAD